MNIVILFLFLICSSITYANNNFSWPKNASTAVSLSYDDSLNSQLDNAIPALNKYKIKASFYIVPSSTSVQTRLEEWKRIPIDGHELGNHTLHHSCRGSLPNRDWVDPNNDLDKRSVNSLKNEVVLANTFLQALDGKTKRTFTIPCGDTLAGGKNYIANVKEFFVAIKGQEMESGFSSLWVPADVSGEELIRYIKNNAKKHKLINIIFHGIGGDHLSVSKQAHEKLLHYLSKNKDIYWIDSYINIMKHVEQQRRQSPE